MRIAVLLRASPPFSGLSGLLKRLVQTKTDDVDFVVFADPANPIHCQPSQSYKVVPIPSQDGPREIEQLVSAYKCRLLLRGLYDDDGMELNGPPEIFFIPHVDHEHPEFSWYRASDVGENLRRGLNQADSLLTLSPVTSQILHLHPEYRGQPISVLRLKPDTSQSLAPESNLPRPYILYGASSWKWKNHQAVLEAFARLQHPNLTLVLTGRPGLTNQQENVFQTGWLSKEQLNQLHTGATLVLCTPLLSGSGSGLMRALGCGAATLASSLQAFRELAADAVAYCEPDAPGIHLALVELLSEPGRLLELRKKVGHLTDAWRDDGESVFYESCRALV